MKTLSTKKQTFKIKDLYPAEYNPRTIKPDSLNGLTKSLDKFGYLQHIVVNIRDNKNTIISGHQRIKALALGENEKIECIVVDFDEVTEKAANVALNAESISGDWVLEDLETILQELQLELPEFEDINLDGLAEDLGIELDNLDSGDEDDGKADEVPETPEKTSIKLGDLIRLGEHFLLCGDSTKAEDVQKLMGEEKAEFIFTDPPYGVGFDYSEHEDKGGKEYKDFITKIWYIIKAMECPIVLTPGNVNLKLWLDLCDFKTACWVKKNAMSPSSIAHLNIFEIILLYNVKARRNTDLLEYAIKQQENVGNHPCPKLLDIVLDCINSWCGEAKILFDPFLGSGSTLIACEKTKRRCFGIEIGPHYVSVIISRWCQYTGNREVMINDKLVEWEEYSA